MDWISDAVENTFSRWGSDARPAFDRVEFQLTKDRRQMAEPKWVAVNEVGNDNFATSIYENDYKGLLVARCNQNGTYPEQAALIIRALEFSNVASLFPAPARAQ